MFGILGVTLALAWFFLVNVAVSAAATAALKTASPGEAHSEAGWFWLRIAPSLAALTFVGAVFLPTYLRFEPRDTIESVGAAACVLALASLALVLHGLWRSAAGWWRASRQARAWMVDAEPLDLPGVPVPVPVYAVRHHHPIVTLVGVWRPRLFVSRQVVATLAPEELRVVVAHEVGHCRARDNVKRLILLASPDTLALARTGRDLEARWTTAAEARADRFAVGEDRGRALALSAALLKVARLMPGAPRLHAPVSSLDDGGLLSGRVQTLLHLTPPAPPAAHMGWMALGLALAVAALLLAASAGLVTPVHHLSELLVRLSA